jgi:endonuclease/exonuclease/phosphatase family metal-dependent hydrolase
VRVVRAATFNVRHGRGLDGEVDLRRTADAIAETGAELFALQELDRFQVRSRGEDQVARLADLTGLSLSFVSTVKKGAAEYGFALAARQPLRLEFELLPRPSSEEPRAVAQARYFGIAVLATHLSTVRGTRRAQTARLAELAAGLDPPVVVMGDLNQGRRALRPLRKAGFDAGRHARHTVTARALNWQADYVLAGPGTTLLHTWTVTTDASDHVPLVAEIAVSLE